MLNIRPATANDTDAVWSIIRPIIRDGQTYALDRDLTKDEALSYWMSADKWTFVAEENGEIFGT